jgi:hypothetical protein
MGPGSAQGSDHSQRPALSPEGKLVAFGSYASNLVPGDSNGRSDVFVRDRRKGATERVSVSSGGAQGGGSFGPAHAFQVLLRLRISPDVRTEVSPG